MPSAIHPTLLARRDAIGELCRRHGVVALDVFGSAADGRFDPEHSDYDFIARFAPRDELSLGRRFVAFSEALEAAGPTGGLDDGSPHRQPVPAAVGGGHPALRVCRTGCPNTCMTR